MSGIRHTISNQYWELEIQNNNRKGFIYKLISKVNDNIYADQDYHYSILTSGKRGSRYAYLSHLGEEYKAKKLQTRTIHLIDDNTLVIKGTFQNTNIEIEHKIKLESCLPNNI
jgi:hypothetical protein